MILFRRGAHLGEVRFEDRGDGTLAVRLRTTVAGAYVLTVQHGPSSALVHVHGSPFAVEVFPAATAPTRAVLAGAGLTRATAGARAAFTVRARDQYDNLQLFDPIVEVCPLPPRPRTPAPRAAPSPRLGRPAARGEGRGVPD